MNSIFIVALSAAFTTTFLVFWITHVYFIITNQTTLESMQRETILEYHNAFYVNPGRIYDFGYKVNFEGVFGKRAQEWIIPKHTSQDNGYIYRINFDDSRYKQVTLE
jgi:hypothetical protein